MVFWTESDASYLSESKASSRAGGFFFIRNKTDEEPPYAETPRNEKIFSLENIITFIFGYENSKEACPMPVTLEEMGYPQPQTPMKVENSTVVTF